LAQVSQRRTDCLQMSPVSPLDGPVAVTGASGWIGSHLVLTLLQHGYDVRACVREVTAAKVDHLLSLRSVYRGGLELFLCDLGVPGSYDAAVAGCSAVFHAGAALGYDLESPQQIYDVGLRGTENVLQSVKKAGSVKRVVFTSSFAAVWHPRPEGYVFTEKDWCGHNSEGSSGQWTKDNIPKSRDLAYAMAKADAERLAKQIADEDGRFDVVSILPLHVLGPVLCRHHNQPYSWQCCVGWMLEGKAFNKVKAGRMLWNVVDVRDVADMHRLAVESSVCKNGARYIAAASDRSGELFTPQLQATLAELYPDFLIGGEFSPGKPTYDSPRSYSLLAKEELGLRQYSIEQTLRATCDSLLQFDLVTPIRSML